MGRGRGRRRAESRFGHVEFETAETSGIHSPADQVGERPPDGRLGPDLPGLVLPNEHLPCSAFWAGEDCTRPALGWRGHVIDVWPRSASGSDVRHISMDLRPSGTFFPSAMATSNFWVVALPSA